MKTFFQHTDREAGTTVFLDRVDEVPNPGPAIQVGVGDRTGPAVHARLADGPAREMALAVLDTLPVPAQDEPAGWVSDLDTALEEAKRVWDHGDAQYEPTILGLIRAVETLRERLGSVERFCHYYTPVPPPLFRGPGLSEHGEGYNHGTRDMANGALSYLANPSDEDDA